MQKPRPPEAVAATAAASAPPSLWMPTLADLLTHEFEPRPLLLGEFLNRCHVPLLMRMGEPARATPYLVDAVVNGSAKLTAGLSRLSGVFDRIAVDLSKRF